MQVERVVLVKMWMLTMAVNEVIRTKKVGMRANYAGKLKLVIMMLEELGGAVRL